MLGDSILAWAGVYAIQRGTPNLQLPSPHSVGWYGIRGMSWTQFTHSLQLRILFQAPPKVIMIHLGGNDLTHTGILPIFNLIRRGINYISGHAPMHISFGSTFCSVCIGRIHIVGMCVSNANGSV